MQASYKSRRSDRKSILPLLLSTTKLKIIQWFIPLFNFSIKQCNALVRRYNAYIDEGSDSIYETLNNSLMRLPIFIWTLSREHHNIQISLFTFQSYILHQHLFDDQSHHHYHNQQQNHNNNNNNITISSLILKLNKNL
eukprot:UN00797